MDRDSIVQSLDNEVANRISPAIKRKLARKLESNRVGLVVSACGSLSIGRQSYYLIEKIRHAL